MTHPVGISDGGFQKVLLNPEPLPKNPSWPCPPTVGSPSLVTPPAPTEISRHLLCVSPGHTAGVAMGTSRRGKRGYTQLRVSTRKRESHVRGHLTLHVHTGQQPLGVTLYLQVSTEMWALLAHACAHTAVRVLMDDVLPGTRRQAVHTAHTTGTAPAFVTQH